MSHQVRKLSLASLLILTLVLINSANSFGQNIVPNGGFENYTSLPNGYGQFYKASGWSNVNGINTGPPYASPDYFHTAGSVGNYFGQIAPHTGSGQMGFYPYLAALVDAREYLMIQLSTPLVVGQQYTLEFYLTNGSGGAYTANTDNIGAHFSVGPLTQAVDEVIPVVPQYEIPGIVEHDNYWQQYTYTFTATTPADYLTFGNFEYDLTTTVINGNKSYLFIDDITLIPISNQMMVSGDTSICLGDMAQLYATNSGSYEWVDSTNTSVTLSTDSVFNTSPTATTTYFVYGDNDTVSWTVNVINPPTVNLGPDITICDGNDTTLDATTANATYLWQDNSTNGTLLVNTAGTYFVEVTANGCSASDTINVNTTPLPLVDLGPDASICQGDSIVLDAATAGGTYLWQDNSSNPTLTANQTGTYWVEVTVNGCSNVDTINATVEPNPVVDLGNDTTICDGYLLILDATTPGATYLWQDNSTNATLSLNSAGQYFVEVAVNGCLGSDTVNVNTIPAPVVDLGADTSFCNGGSVVLDATTASATYIWQDNSTNATFTANQTGSYSVDVTVNGCTNSDTVDILVYPIPGIDLGNDTTLCPGEVLLLDASTTNASYLWQDNSTNPTYTASQNGTYSVVLNVNGCTTSDDIVVNYFAEPDAGFSGPTEGCAPFNATFTSNTNGNSNCVWSFSDGTTINGCGNVSHYFDVGVYDVTLTVTSADGCMNSFTASQYLTVSEQPIAIFSTDPDSVSVLHPIVNFNNNSVNAYGYEWHFGDSSGVSNETDPQHVYPEIHSNYQIDLIAFGSNPACSDTTSRIIYVYEEPLFYVPNIFTPNGDEYNNYFQPVFTSGFDPYNFHLTIFNRWGEVIFESYNATQGWNGHYGDGGIVQDGVYVWQIEFKDAHTDSKYLKKGTVTVLK